MLKRLDEAPALFSGGREHGAQSDEILSTSGGPEAAGDFLPDLHHAQIAFSQIIREGHARIDRKRCCNTRLNPLDAAYAAI